MNDEMLDWETARKFLGVGKNNSAKYRVPHEVKKKKAYYALSDLVEFKIHFDKTKSKMSHATGKDGFQSLARTVLMFAAVEARKPAEFPQTRKDTSMTAKDFLSGENWYTELLENIAEWPDFFKICERYFDKQGNCSCLQ
jgi:hypothetical protein